MNYKVECFLSTPVFKAAIEAVEPLEKTLVSVVVNAGTYVCVFAISDAEWNDEAMQ